MPSLRCESQRRIDHGAGLGHTRRSQSHKGPYLGGWHCECDNTRRAVRFLTLEYGLRVLAGSGGRGRLVGARAVPGWPGGRSGGAWGGPGPINRVWCEADLIWSARSKGSAKLAPSATNLRRKNKHGTVKRTSCRQNDADPGRNRIPRSGLSPAIVRCLHHRPWRPVSCAATGGGNASTGLHWLPSAPHRLSAT